MEFDLKKYDVNEEFYYIINKYLLPLMGMVKDDEEGIIEFDNFGYIPNKNIDLFEGKLFFSYSLNEKKGFKIDVSNKFNEKYLSIIRIVYAEICKVTYNNFSSMKKRNNLVKNISDLDVLYKNAVQKGIIEWLFSTYGNSVKARIARFLDVLEDWSKKTYEGKKVPYAFSINLQNESVIDNQAQKLPYLDFLQDEYSATLSDGINSIIELDLNLNFIEYHSITNGNKFEECLLSTGMPYRFAEIISRFTDGKIAFFLLISGDIIVVKNKKIELVKREGTWLNFNQDIFVNVLRGSYDINEELIQSIYASSLDVSFSHGGGIIAIINDIYDLRKNNIYDFICHNYEKFSKKEELNYEIGNMNKSILDYIDDLTLNIPNLDVLALKYSNYYNDKKEKLKKRFDKRNILHKLVSNKKFCDIDRKLRAELVGMDGATIINKDGEVLSIGAIIQNESGSYGGGRGAAAKRLSQYGMAIKISTDGYIEVYIAGKLKYKIK